MPERIERHGAPATLNVVKSKPGGSPRMTAGQIVRRSARRGSHRLFAIHVAYLRFTLFAAAAKTCANRSRLQNSAEQKGRPAQRGRANVHAAFISLNED
jgi:hypothetical protein